MTSAVSFGTANLSHVPSGRCEKIQRLPIHDKRCIIWDSEPVPLSQGHGTCPLVPIPLVPIIGCVQICF